MAAILDDDGFLVIALHVRQRLGQDAGLIERADVGRVGHEAGLDSREVGRVLADWRAARKASRAPFPLSATAKNRHPRRGHAAASASVSQLAISNVPPVGGASGNRLCPANWRSVRSPAKSAAATTKPNAAAMPS